MPARLSSPPQTASEALTPQTLATILEEPDTRLLTRVLGTLGPDTAVDLLVATLQCESAGGMLTRDGSRPRTRGGVFLFMARKKVREASGKRVKKRVFR